MQFVLCSDKLCSPHVQKLIELAVLHVVGLALLASVFRLAMALRNGGAYLRIVMAVDQLEPLLLMKQGQPPPLGRAYALEVGMC